MSKWRIAVIRLWFSCSLLAFAYAGIARRFGSYEFGIFGFVGCVFFMVGYCNLLRKTGMSDEQKIEFFVAGRSLEEIGIMTPKEIREVDDGFQQELMVYRPQAVTAASVHGCFEMLREIAAQLAELNEQKGEGR